MKVLAERIGVGNHAMHDLCSHIPPNNAGNSKSRCLIVQHQLDEDERIIDRDILTASVQSQGQTDQQ